VSVFDSVAELYDRVRPAYPPAVIDDVAALGPRILEIGPGTGQATRALVERGAEVTAVERGPQLAAIARRNVPADFETWEPKHAGYDAVVPSPGNRPPPWIDEVGASASARRRSTTSRR
jgi:SAM-dependent methyltransferase